MSGANKNNQVNYYLFMKIFTNRQIIKHTTYFVLLMALIKAIM